MLSARRCCIRKDVAIFVSAAESEEFLVVGIALANTVVPWVLDAVTKWCVDKLVGIVDVSGWEVDLATGGRKALASSLFWGLVSDLDCLGNGGHHNCGEFHGLCLVLICFKFGLFSLSYK